MKNRLSALNLFGGDNSSKILRLEMTKGQSAKLDGVIKRSSGIANRRALINNALTLFTWAVEQREAGRTIGSINKEESKYFELSFKSLDGIAPKT